MIRLSPELLTFDIFGTVVDWRRGLGEALERYGIPLADADFDSVIDDQAAREAGPFRPYADIVASSLRHVLGLPAEAARAIAAGAGRWPLFPDSRAGLARLARFAPCVAMTNSDEAHGRQAQTELGHDMSGWICAEAARCYKPDRAFWRHVAARRGVGFGPHWWHVSAYADYDLETARGLGLTTVLVARPHAREGPAGIRVHDLIDLARRVEAAA
ncbi:MAG: hypothetical protein HY568_07090 [Candidatus Latescibacteria bacterium]|nr:hypothetical protein [Candidatus Latescibacterota bacterium]